MILKFEYGINKSPMGFDFSHNQIGGAFENSYWQAKSFKRKYIKWSTMDLSHGSSMERFTQPVSSISNLSSKISGMGAQRCLGEDTIKVSFRLKNSRKDGFGRDFYRRQLCSGQKRGSRVGKTKRGKGTKIMAIVDGNGFPLAVSTYSASPHEVTLVEETISKRFIRNKPKRIIGDKAYDSDKLDCTMKSKGIKMIAPNRSNKKVKTQDGRELRRYRKRWKVERLFAWIQNFRRCQTRWDYHDVNYEGFVQLACIVILLRNYF